MSRLDVAALPAVVAGMTNGEWAAALYHSDMPARRSGHTPDQLVTWIVQGTARLGGEVEVWRIDWELRRVFDQHQPADWDARERLLFGKPRRLDQARGEAFGLSLALGEAGVRRRFPTVRVFLPPDEEFGDVYSVEIPARDVEMARRLHAAGEVGAAA